MSRVFWDTNLFIYLIEGHGPRADKVEALHRRMRERGDQLFTSALTLGEVLVRPLEAQDTALVKRYESTIANAATLLSFDRSAAVAFATIRRDRSIKPPDTVQLACASAAGIDLFVTNDERLSRKVVAGVQFITSLERVPL